MIEHLADAPAAAIEHVVVVARGRALHWPRLDIDVGVPELVAGCFGSRAWMSTLAKAAGAVSTPAKARAARENGRKGGRPRKTPAPATGA
jgi:hypothetical protein